MQGTLIEYKVKTASEAAIYQHLLECDKYFKPPLSEKVEISVYSKKIFNKAVTFEAWNNAVLVGLLAAYFDQVNKFAFITNVSVAVNTIKSGIASQLMKMCIEHAYKIHAKEIILEVNSQNIHAIGLYKKFSFIHTDTKGEEHVMNLAIAKWKNTIKKL